MIDFKGKERYLKHYEDPEVQSQMLYYTKNREVAVLAPSWTHKDEEFQNGQRNFRVDEPYVIRKIHRFKTKNSDVPMQWYYSLAHYSTGLPFKNFLIPKEQKTHWVINHWKQIISYDFCIDVDAPSFNFKEQAFKDAQRIAYDLSEWASYIEIRDSGKGYHIIVPYRCFTKALKSCSFDPYKENNIYSELKKIALYYYRIFSEMVDTSIYDSRRIVKIPGTLAIYEDRIVECQIVEVVENAR